MSEDGKIKKMSAGKGKAEEGDGARGIRGNGG